jgi:cyclopropane fatty-acyl-phospholipid synthase-like methyltransferase
MKIKRWGEEVWEDKIKTQGEVEVVGGTVASLSELKRMLKHTTRLIKTEFLRFIKPQGKILDCGVGPLADYSIFLAKEGYNVTGVDISKTTLNHAKKYIEKAKVNVNLIQDNFADFKKVKNQYDLVFCTGTFLHIPSYLAIETFKQFNKKTKKDGYCLIQFAVEKEKNIKQICWDFLYQITFKIKKRFVKVFPVNCSSYTREEILDLSKRTGFRFIKEKENYFFFQKIKEIN